MLNIRVANINDLDSIMNVYALAREYMASKGNSTQWGDNYPSRNLIMDDIVKGKCYVACSDNIDFLNEQLVDKKSDNEICAVFYFAIEDDPVYEKIDNGTWRNDRPYAVVHRIAVNGNSHNKGVAGQCIDYAVRKCKKSNIFDLRMDTHKDNIPMQHFLEKHDFRPCGTVFVGEKQKRLAYHKVIIKNVVFDVGQVLLEFDWKRFIAEMNITEDKKKKLINVTLGNIAHWNNHDRGMDDEEFIRQSLAIEPDIEEELTYYLKHIGTIVKEYDYAVPYIRELKSRGYKVYILSNYGRNPFKYAREHMRFFDEVDGMVVSYEEGRIKPEREIYQILLDRYNLYAEECVFIDDREENVEAAKSMGMSGVVFDNIDNVKRKLEIIL